MSVLVEAGSDVADPDVLYPATVPDMAESGLHSLVRFLTYGALRGHFAGRPGCFVGQDRNLYYRPHPEAAFVVPDVFVCFGVDPSALEVSASYRLWDAGAPPAFVLEIASERTHRRDRQEKPAIYLEVGVDEYWRFDPTGGDLHTPILQGDRRIGGAWEPIPTVPDGGVRLRGLSRALGLDLHAEPRRLRLRDPRTGNWLADPEETRQQRDDARLALDVTRHERDAAEDRAEAAEAELAALRARLNDRDGATPR